jgi:hypothetical protein
MRKPRSNFTYHPDAAVVRSHCHSAFGGPWPGFTDDEREEFVRDLFAASDFAGIKIVAFSVQPTEFDLIVDVPRAIRLSKKEMFRRFEEYTDPIFFGVENKRLKAGEADSWARLTARFGDLAALLKSLKQKASHRYHRNHGTSGAIWGNRYTRAFLQPGRASRVLAAWMDHAAVRNGECSAPDDDRFSTFGRAVAGDERARAMITALHAGESEPVPWRSVAKAYRDFVADDTIPPDAPQSHRNKPLLTRAGFLRSEVPHFRRGMAIGDRAFVESLFELNRAEFGPERKSGARRIIGQCDPDLWTLRNKTDLRKLRD